MSEGSGPERNNRATALREHHLGGLSGAEKCAAEIYVHHLRPDFGLNFGGGKAGADPGIVDQYIDAPAVRCDGREDTLDLPMVCDVELMRFRQRTDFG